MHGIDVDRMAPRFQTVQNRTGKSNLYSTWAGKYYIENALERGKICLA